MPALGFREFPFSCAHVAVVDLHARATAVAIAEFLNGVGKGHVPRWTDRSLRKPPPTSMGRNDSSASGSFRASKPQRRLYGDESERAAVTTRPLCIEQRVSCLADAARRWWRTAQRRPASGRQETLCPVDGKLCIATQSCFSTPPKAAIERSARSRRSTLCHPVPRRLCYISVRPLSSRARELRNRLPLRSGLTEQVGHLLMIVSSRELERRHALRICHHNIGFSSNQRSDNFSIAQ